MARGAEGDRCPDLAQEILTPRQQTDRFTECPEPNPPSTPSGQGVWRRDDAAELGAPGEKNFPRQECWRSLAVGDGAQEGGQREKRGRPQADEDRGAFGPCRDGDGNHRIGCCLLKWKLHVQPDLDRGNDGEESQYGAGAAEDDEGCFGPKREFGWVAGRGNCVSRGRTDALGGVGRETQRCSAGQFPPARAFPGRWPVAKGAQPFPRNLPPVNSARARSPAVSVKITPVGEGRGKAGALSRG